MMGFFTDDKGQIRKTHKKNGGKIFTAIGGYYDKEKSSLTKEQLERMELNENTTIGRGRFHPVKVDEQIVAHNKEIALKKFQEKYPKLNIHPASISQVGNATDPRTGEHILSAKEKQYDGFVFDETVRTPEAGHDRLTDTLISKEDRRKEWKKRGQKYTDTG